MPPLLLLTGLFVALFAIITAFILARFSALRRFPQPTKALLLGVGSGTITALFWIPATFLTAISGQACFMVILISTMGPALISIIGSTETISQKTKDEPVKKSDDGSGTWTIP